MMIQLTHLLVWSSSHLYKYVLYVWLAARQAVGDLLGVHSSRVVVAGWLHGRPSDIGPRPWIDDIFVRSLWPGAPRLRKQQGTGD